MAPTNDKDQIQGQGTDGNSNRPNKGDTNPDSATGGDQVHEFSSINKSPKKESEPDMNLILDIPLEITIELGRTRMLINDLLKLGQGSIIEIPKNAGDTLEILANNRLIAKGDVVVINDKYGIRLTEVISPVERVEGLK
ncbi:MAG: flagellar motor switch protein FliN [Desulfobacteraceae bacterium]|nr:flagellar motor switch protein FliN [Desulfobacteraceae bacterium]